MHNQAFIGKSTHNCRSIEVPLVRVFPPCLFIVPTSLYIKCIKYFFTCSTIVHLVLLSYLLKIFLKLIYIVFQPKRSQAKRMTCCVLLWEFNIIPSPTSVTIRPPKLDILEDILNDLLVNLDEPLLCNCIKQPLYPMRLVKIHGA